MSNRTAVLAGYRKKWQAAATELAQAQRVAKEAFAGLRAEMKSGGFSRGDIAGVKLTVRRGFETDAQRVARREAEDIAAALAEFEA